MKAEQDLTNEQIDKIIKKLEAQKKKVEKALKFQPTKEQKQILSQLVKILKYDPDFIEEECIETTIYNLEEVFSQDASEMEEKIEYQERYIEDYKDQIEVAKEQIKDFQESIKIYNKELKKLKQEELKLTAAYKLFDKLKKISKGKK